MSFITYKATSIISMRELIKARGEAFEQAFLEKLAAQEKSAYLHALPVTHIKEDSSLEEKSIYYIAAHMLYPKAVHPVQELGKAIAGCEIKGVYKIFFRIATMEFILNRAAKIWRQYNDQGKAAIENYKLDHKVMACEFVVRDYPEFSQVRKEYLAGYISALIHYAKGTVISIDLPQQYEPHKESRWFIKAQF